MGTLVNDIYIEKEDSEGEATGLFKVPVTYAPKDKILQRYIQDPEIDRPSATSAPLPIISFEKTQMYYDQDRKLPTTNRVVIRDSTDPSKHTYQYNFVPWNFDFKVYIYAKNAEDGTKVLEQILPFFTPNWTVPVMLISSMEEQKDIEVVLKNVEYQDTYTGDYTERRSIIWTLNLTVKGYLYGPIKRTGIIKFVKVNFRIPDVADGELDNVPANTAISAQVTVQPGLTANGEPTTNIADTIAYTEIDIDDDFGYITLIHELDDVEQDE